MRYRHNAKNHPTHLSGRSLLMVLPLLGVLCAAIALARPPAHELSGSGGRHQPALSPQNTQAIKTVFIILMENRNWLEIKGSPSAPYINNTLLPMASHAEQYFNPPRLHPSLPNYLWLEAGNNFGIFNDALPGVNHQSTTNHLVTLLNNAGILWKSYQEDTSGNVCPLTDNAQYAPKHNPMVYFDDVTNSNDPNSQYCIAHVRPYAELAADLQGNNVGRYNFITPNLCHDMHDCPTADGDTWLSEELPKILNSQAYKDGGAVFITWDEGEGGDGPIGMIVVSPLAKGGGYSNEIHYTHSSTLRTMEEIFGLTPLLGDAANATDLSDLFAAPIPTPSPSPTPTPTPTLSNVVVTSPVNENDTAAISGNISDPNAGDPLTLTINWGDGSAPQTFNYAAGTSSFHETHKYLDDTPKGTPSDNYIINLTLNDKHGGTATTTTTITVNNVAPSIVSLSLSANPINENDTVTLNGSFTDPGTQDTHAVAINWGDGSPNTTLNLAAGVLTFSTAHQYTKSGNFTIGATATDDDTGTGTASASISVNTPAPSLQFSTANFRVDEGDGAAPITVTRTGDTTTAVSVDFATSDDSASQKNRYTATAGTLNFAAGETSKSFSVPIIDEAYVEGTQTVHLTLSNPTGGAVLGSQSTATLTIIDNDTVQPTTNPIDETRFFVRQHYLDFLSRVPDQAGFDYWTGQIDICGTDPKCINARRVGVSAAYFTSQEFQDTGFFVYLFYIASFGEKPGYAQFLPDRSRVVGGADLNAGKAAFATLWVRRADFLAKYPRTMTGDQFVDTLIQTVKTADGVDLASQRAALISQYDGTDQGRAGIVRALVENASVRAAEFNPAFVLMQYFGYLRRDPDADGYQFWLKIMNGLDASAFQGMTCAFITSIEYQERFSPVHTRTNATCGQ